MLGKQTFPDLPGGPLLATGPLSMQPRRRAAHLHSPPLMLDRAAGNSSSCNLTRSKPAPPPLAAHPRISVLASLLWGVSGVDRAAKPACASSLLQMLRW
jgi:hypothetical protein